MAIYLQILPENAYVIVFRARWIILGTRLRSFSRLNARERLRRLVPRIVHLALKTMPYACSIANFGTILRQALRDPETTDVFRGILEPMMEDQTKKLKKEIRSIKVEVEQVKQKTDDLEKEWVNWKLKTKILIKLSNINRNFWNFGL